MHMLMKFIFNLRQVSARVTVTYIKYAKKRFSECSKVLLANAYRKSSILPYYRNFVFKSHRKTESFLLVSAFERGFFILQSFLYFLYGTLPNMPKSAFQVLQMCFWQVLTEGHIFYRTDR